MVFSLRLHLHRYLHSLHSHSDNLQSTSRDQYRQVQFFYIDNALLEQLDLAHLHRTSCIIASGAGGRVVITGTNIPIIVPSIAFLWGQHRVCYMVIVPNKKLVMRSQYGLMKSSLCGRQSLQLSLKRNHRSEGFGSFEVCLCLVHPANQLFHCTSCLVIWLFPTTEVNKNLQDRRPG